MALIGSSHFKSLADIRGQKTKIAIPEHTLAAALEPKMIQDLRVKLQRQKVKVVVIHLGDNDISPLLANLRKLDPHSMGKNIHQVAAKILINQMNELIRQVNKVVGAEVQVYVIDLFWRSGVSKTFEDTRHAYNGSMNQLKGATPVRFSKRLYREKLHFFGDDGVHLSSDGSRFLAATIKKLINPL